MSISRLNQLEDAVNRLIQRNVQLQELCQQLQAGRDGWQHQRAELLTEIEELLADMKLLRKGVA